MILSYRWTYSNADHIYSGTDRVLGAERDLGVRNISNEHTVGLEIGVVERLSLVLEVPFLYGDRSLEVGPPSDGRIEGSLTQIGAGLGDIRALSRYWLLDASASSGNIALEAGLKMPTGTEDERSTFDGEVLYHDLSVQTGTGSWDVILGASGFVRYGHVVPFASVRYLMTPKEDTGTPAFHPQLADPATTVVNSIPDQLSWRAGVSVDAGGVLRGDDPGREPDALDRLSVSLAVVGSHVLENDLVGGSDGFRRSFNAYFVEPGFEWWITDAFAVNASAPVTLYRDLTGAPGTFPEVQFSMGCAFRF